MGALRRRGTIWWLLYYRSGKRCEGSSGTDKKREAEKLLTLRDGRFGQGAAHLAEGGTGDVR